MKKIIFCAVLASMFVSAAPAAEKVPTALETLKQGQKQLKESGKYLLSMESDNAKLRPRYWWIRFYDEKLLLKVRSVHMIGPEIIENIIPGNPFDGGNANHIIMRDQIKYDSEYCINFMEKAAKANKIPLHSLKVKLEKPYPGETNPMWSFEWFDEAHKSLGSIVMSATTAKVTKIVRLKLKKFEGVSHKTMGQNVEDTFLGVGGDLEEFFTGKRTVDQPEDTEGKSKLDKADRAAD